MPLVSMDQQRWEYQVVTLDMWAADVGKRLDALGEECWELVQLAPTASMPHMLAVLKRPRGG